MTNIQAKWGGTAFPCEGGDGSGLYPDPGMSLRDYIAVKAMAAICAHPDTWGLMPPEIVAKSYQIADAMLAEREKGGAS